MDDNWCSAGFRRGLRRVGSRCSDELLAPDAVDRSGPHPVNGVASFKARAAGVRAAFGDIDVGLDERVIGDGSIAWRWSLNGMHVGFFAGVAATGRRVTLRGVNFQGVADGKVTEHWTLVDVAGAVQALKVG